MTSSDPPLHLPLAPPLDVESRQRRFAVAISYAGEDRPIVAAVAEALAQKLGQERVLYDKAFEAELARVDLDVYLPKLYRDDAELIIVFLSPDYERKRWCGLEWRWIRQLIVGPAQQRIMLLRLGDPGDLSAQGILAGDGYAEVADRPPARIADLILQRYRLEQSRQRAKAEAEAASPPREEGGSTTMRSLLQMPPSEAQQLLERPQERLLRWIRRRGGRASLFVVIAGIGAIGAARTSDALKRQGDRDLRLGVYDQAQVSFAAAQRWNPFDPGARRGSALAALGSLLPQMGDPLKATSFTRQLETLQQRWPQEPMVKLFAGDQAFQQWLLSGFTNEALLEKAEADYRAASPPNKSMAEAHARLGFLFDVRGDLDQAEKEWSEALKLAGNDLALASWYRNGLANVLEQQPGGRQKALASYVADSASFPLSALEAAMLLWQGPASSDDLGLAQQHLSKGKPAGEGPAMAWGFKADGMIVAFGRKEAHRCLHGLALAATQHLRGRDGEALATRSGVKDDCAPVEADARLVVCDRLLRASQAGNPRAAATRSWMACPAVTTVR